MLHEVESSQVNNNVRKFFEHGFSELQVARRRRGLDAWPTQRQLDILCERVTSSFSFFLPLVHRSRLRLRSHVLSMPSSFFCVAFLLVRLYYRSSLDIHVPRLSNT